MTAAGIRPRPIAWRAQALLLIAFAMAGLAGAWQGLSAWLLVPALAWLPGAVALIPWREGRASSGERALTEGPGAIALAVCVSLLVLVPTVLPLFLLARPLAEARYTWSVTMLCLAVTVLARLRARSGDVGDDATARSYWLAVAVAVACLLPTVLAHAGGAVDDWWDLAFVRAYAERSLASFAEPMIASGAVHPRFLWNGWLVLQALVASFGGADPAAVQSGALATFVCVASVSAATAFAQVVFGRERPAALLTVLLLPAWIYGTEALPYFTRLQQDKFVVALVVMPVMLAAAVVYAEQASKRTFALLALAMAAAASVHAVLLAVGSLGVALCVLATAWRRSFLRFLGDRHIHWLAALLAVLAFYPGWQAWTLRARFAAQGISLTAIDNPVVRAHLLLERLVGAPHPAYVVHPAAVFGPIALVAAVGLVLALRRRSERGDAHVALLTLVPAALVFVPFLAAAAGSLIVPWMLYRIGWLIPVTPLIALALEGAWWARRPLIRWSACALVVTAITGLALATARDRLARDMQEHPGTRERAPSGTTLEVYRFLADQSEGGGAVIAPMGFAGLVPAMTGLPTVALSERGTLVFSSSEAEAYRRLRDRADFFAHRVGAAERSRIAGDYQVAWAVFRRHWMVHGSETAWLARSSPEGFALEQLDEQATWTVEAVRAALPTNWRPALVNEDFVIMQAPPPAHPRAQTTDFGFSEAHWLEVLQPDEPAVVSDGEVLASVAGWPGAEIGIHPTPTALGLSDRLVWLGGSMLWDDGPEEVSLTIELATACRVTAIDVVPFLRTERREVFEVLVDGRTRRLPAHDGEPMTVPLTPRSRRSVSVSIRSLIGTSFGLGDIRVLGERGSCAGGWQPRMRPLLPQDRLTLVSHLAIARDYGASARSVIGLARALVERERGDDAIAVLRQALRRDPSVTAAWLELGVTLDARGRFDEALDAYAEALRTDSNSAWANGCMAWARLRQHRTLAALYRAWRAARLDPRYSDAFTILAASLKQLGLRSRARNLLLHAIELDRRRPWPYLELARLDAEEGRHEEAERALASLLEHVPDDDDAQQMLASLRSERPVASPTG